MVIRFRYTTPDGAVVELYDLDGLMRHVIDGHVTENTELFDALTQVTAPAHEQAAFQLVAELIPHRERAVAEAADASSESEADQEHEADATELESADLALPDAVPSKSSDDELNVPGLEMTLAQFQDPESTEEVVRKMERERAREELAESSRGEGETLTVSPFNEQLRSWRGDESSEDDPVASVADSSEPEPIEPEAVEPEPRPKPRKRRRRVEASDVPDLTIPLWMLDRFVKSGGPELARLRRHAAQRERAMAHRVVRSPFVAALAATMLVATISVGMGEPSRRVPTRVRVLDTAPPPIDLVGVADRLAASGGIALDHMIGAMDSVAADFNVKNVPHVWLEIDYFTHVYRYPQVRAHWVRYSEFVDELRVKEEELFRQGYVSRLEELGVSTAVMSMRLASAVRVFEAGAPQRDSVYANMDRLAERALQLHDLLLNRNASIRLDPGAEVGVARDPFLQFVTDEPELKEEILAHIDAILSTLEALHGDAKWTRDRLNTGILASLGERASGG